MERARQAFQNKGLKLTPLRQSVFREIAASHKAIGAYEVLDRLREDHRRALVLFELEQLPVREIAQMLGRTEGNVRVLVHRARAAFLKRMIRERKRGAKETP